MAKRRSVKKRGLLLLTAFIAAAGVGVPLSVTQAEPAVAATTYSYTYVPSKKAKHVVPSLGVQGVCVNHAYEGKSGRATAKIVANTSRGAQVAHYYAIKLKWYTDTSSVSRAKWLRKDEAVKKVLQYVYHPTPFVKGHTSMAVSITKKLVAAVPKDYKVPDNFVMYYFSPVGGGAQNFAAWKVVPYGSLKLVKATANSTVTRDGNYNFTGIKYTLYKSDKKTKAGVLTCKADGTSNTIGSLAEGTYYAKETATNKYYKLDTKWVSAKVTSGKTTTLKVSDTPSTAQIQVVKKAENPSVLASSQYSFEGIQYGIYRSDKKTLLQTLTLSNSGTGTARKGVSPKSKALPLGIYYIKETKTNRWFKLDNSFMKASLTANAQLLTVSVTDKEEKGHISILKKLTDGKTTEEAFVFKLTNTAVPSLVYEMKVKGDGKAVTKDVVAGTYRLTEIDSGNYDDETGPVTITVMAGETYRHIHENKPEEPKGRLKVTKRITGSGSVEGFAFRVTGLLDNAFEITGEEILAAADPGITAIDAELLELGEWKISDEEIRAINEAAKARETGSYTVTLRNSAQVKRADSGDDGGTDDGEADPADYGGGDDEQSDKDEPGSSTGEYSAGVSEIEILVPVEILLKESIYDETEGKYKPQINDKKRQEKTGTGYTAAFNSFTFCGAGGKYRDSLTGEEYSTMVTNGAGQGLWNGQRSIEPLTPGIYTVEEVMTAAQAERYHQPEPQTMMITKDEPEVTLSFTFNNVEVTKNVRLIKTSSDGKVSGISFSLSGKTAYGEEVRKTGISDADGGIDFGDLPRGEYVIEETGWDPAKYANPYKLEGYDVPAQKITVTGDESDGPIVVSFENKPLGEILITKIDKEKQLFLPGATFHLNNKSAGKTEAEFRILSEDGMPAVEMIQGEGNIKAVDHDDAAGEDGYSFVKLTGLTSGDVYEVAEVDAPQGYGIAEKAAEITASHDETPKIIVEDDTSSIATTATDRKTGDHHSLEEDSITIVDRVVYKNLVPGKEYTVKGVLMDKTRYMESGDVNDVRPLMISGREVTAEKTFTAKTADGEEEIVFTFHGKGLGGKSLVAYEKLFDAGGRVADHEDPEDPEQTVTVPGIGTIATGEGTKEHLIDADGNARINDEVNYEGLIIGKTYELTGTIMDKETGEPLMAGGQQVSASRVFTAEDSSGVIDITFCFNAEGMEGKDLVAFERLFIKNNPVPVARHEDINDRNQTVHIPVIGTKAGMKSRTILRDTVAYRNLIPGRTYRMTGTLMDKDTGEETGYAASRDFTAQSPEGQIHIDFKIDPEELEGRTVVAFERCFLMVRESSDSDKLLPVKVASHEDLEDGDQTVDFKVPELPGQPGEPPGTGQDFPWVLILCAAAFTFSGIRLIFRRIKPGEERA